MIRMKRSRIARISPRPPPPKIPPINNTSFVFITRAKSPVGFHHPVAEVYMLLLIAEVYMDAVDLALYTMLNSEIRLLYR